MGRLIVDADAAARIRIALRAFADKTWTAWNQDALRALAPMPDGDAIPIDRDEDARFLVEIRAENKRLRRALLGRDVEVNHVFATNLDRRGVVEPQTAVYNILHKLAETLGVRD